jgi:hypothetical protein
VNQHDGSGPAPGPTVEDARALFPGWHCWKGVGGLFYARLPLTSPPVVARGKDPAGLISAIRTELRRRS